MEEKNREQIKRYFEVFPGWSIAAIAIGVVIVAASDGFLGYAVGIAAIGLAGLAIFRWSTQRPTDQQMDAWRNEDLDQLGAKAMAKSCLDSSDVVRDPVVVVGPRLRNLGGAFFGFRRGTDGKARFTPLNVTVINFTENQLVTYQCALDLTTGNALNECVDEYFYNDVVSVATKSETLTCALNELDEKVLSQATNLKKLAVNDSIQVNSAESFVLSTSGGTSVQVRINEPILVQGLGGGSLPTELSENAVQAVRKMLRDKKAGALPLRQAAI